jgi:hypothetical protein
MADAEGYDEDELAAKQCQFSPSRAVERGEGWGKAAVFELSVTHGLEPIDAI